LAASFSINNKARTGTTATLTTTAAHNLVVNQVVTIASVESALNGKVVVTSVPTSTTFTYTTATSGTIASAAVSPVGTVQIALAQALVVNDIICGINEIPEAGQIDIEADGGITN
jgi:hypothetical protein